MRVLLPAQEGGCNPSPERISVDSRKGGIYDPFMISLRPETPSDAEALDELLTVAFAFDELSQLDEPRIVRALRDQGDLSVALIAESTTTQEIAGFIAFSPVTIEDGAEEWYALGPIAVDPRLQRLGIGRKLMEEGLTRLQALGAKGCVVIADPPFYTQFGFRVPVTLHVEPEKMDCFLVRVFSGEEPSGRVRYASAFDPE